MGGQIIVNVLEIHPEGHVVEMFYMPPPPFGGGSNKSIREIRKELERLNIRMKKFVTFALAAGFCYWRFVVTPRLNLPTEVGTLEALVHFFMGWVLCIFFCIRKPTDYHGNIRSGTGPSPEVPWPNLIPDCIIMLPGVLKTWCWLYTRQWFYFLAFLIPTLFEVYMVMYQMKAK